jgi:hypothetical protein
MLKFKLKLQATEIAVHPHNVTHITDRQQHGTVIHFVGGGSVHVEALYGEVYAVLSTRV